VSVDDAAALHSQLWRFRRAIALPDYAGDYPQDMLGCAGSWPLWSVYRKRHQPLPPWSPRLLQFRHEPGPVGMHLGVAVDQILHLIRVGTLSGLRNTVEPSLG
jgi:hypothetical protein